MPLTTGDPLKVRRGPGVLLIAEFDPADPTVNEPDDIDTPWDTDWVPLGYTKDGSEFVFDQSFDDIEVAEELEPIDVVQTSRVITVNFAAAEMTAENLSLALNGGDVSTAAGIVTFEPPDVGDVTRVRLGWESDDGLERWVFRRCVQVGSVNIGNRKGADYANIPMSFRATKPGSGLKSCVRIADVDFVAGS